MYTVMGLSIVTLKIFFVTLCFIIGPIHPVEANSSQDEEFGIPTARCKQERYTHPAAGAV
jgi:hypothetical protein